MKNRTIYLTKAHTTPPFAWTFSDNNPKGNIYRNLTLESMRRLSSLTYKHDIETKIVMINHFELTTVIKSR